MVYQTFRLCRETYDLAAAVFLVYEEMDIGPRVRLNSVIDRALEHRPRTQSTT